MKKILVVLSLAVCLVSCAFGNLANAEDNLTKSIKVDVTQLKGTDGQPLIIKGDPKDIPDRPEDPKALPEDNKGHWWDQEYAGWTTQKKNMPSNDNATGAIGKTVVMIRAGDHPYWTAFMNGFNAIAKEYNLKVKEFSSNWNQDLQAQQVDQAINDRPDIIILAPVDATACTPLFRKINRAGIPLIACNTIPCDSAMQYCVAWTGPDDWGQMRMLAHSFADQMDGKGGYAIVRHMPGSSPFFARTFGPITELKDYAPNMKLLDMDTANLETEGTMQLVSAWLTKYGKDLKGLFLSGDGFTVTGTLEALKSAGRDDIVIVAAGNSKTGMDSVKAGEVYGITYQSAEGDGALACYTACRFLNGEKLDPVNYIPKHVITEIDVDEFMPAQW